MLPIEPSAPDADLQAAEEMEDWDTAERLYSLVVNIDPPDSTSAFNLANMLRAQRKLIEAEAAYRTAVERNWKKETRWVSLFVAGCFFQLGGDIAGESELRGELMRGSCSLNCAQFSCIDPAGFRTQWGCGNRT